MRDEVAHKSQKQATMIVCHLLLAFLRVKGGARTRDLRNHNPTL